VGGYKRYIEGVYYQNTKLMEVLDKKGRQNSFEALRKGYPQGWTYQELADTYKIKSTYHNCDALLKENIIKAESVTGSRRKNATKYYFEDYNYINNKNGRFPFAPGYVQYTEEFLGNYKTLNEKFKYDIFQIYSLLVPILREAVRNEKQGRTCQQCKFCRYDHEMRDFMRATLLHLIDELETNIEFIDLLWKEEIINKETYERLVSEYRHTTPNTIVQEEPAQKEVMKEQQSTHFIENEEQRAKDATPPKQYKRKPLTAARKKQISLDSHKWWDSRTENDRQKHSDSIRKYPINHHAFDKLTPDAKYWMGYIMARGNVKRGSGNPTVRISVTEESRRHLDKFKVFIKPHQEDPDLPVRYYEKKHVCVLEFRSGIIVSKLEKYGIHNNMRYREKVKILENDTDFWRGFIDGNTTGRSGKFEVRDGKISMRIKKGRELILQFKSFAENILGHSTGEPEPGDKNWSLTITEENAVELLKLLYDKHNIALEGNLKKIEQILSLPEYKTKS
jgi:hypothetical protein